MATSASLMAGNMIPVLQSITITQNYTWKGNNAWRVDDVNWRIIVDFDVSVDSLGETRL